MDISDNNSLSTKEKGRYAQGTENKVKNRFHPCHCLFIVLNPAKPKKNKKYYYFYYSGQYFYFMRTKLQIYLHFF